MVKQQQNSRINRAAEELDEAIDVLHSTLELLNKDRYGLRVSFAVPSDQLETEEVRVELEDELKAAGFK
jgi:hypothetical protein